MSSGYGLAGGPSRCFPFWQELLACYVVNTNTEDSSGGKKCLPVMEDYYECLHHRKELARTKSLQIAYRKKELEFPRENTARTGSIRNLGLLDKEEDSKAIVEASKKR
ncbi:hypothetical protein MMC31_005311 [Peltigera leucophlebia]|nr:hypothetical protein [Peltigera leucophlebia]